MKQDYTDITLVLDKSGSMVSIWQSAINSIDSFFSDQGKLPGECRVSVFTFDVNFNCLVRHQDIRNSEAIDSLRKTHTGGYTALYDAVGHAINNTGKRLAALREEDRPSNVLFVIQTDGYENASKEFSLSKVKEMINHQKEKYNWHFVFLGANIDAEGVGQSIGIGFDTSVNYAFNAAGVSNVYSSLNTKTAKLRTREANSISFTQDDKEQILTETNKFH